MRHKAGKIRSKMGELRIEMFSHSGHAFEIKGGRDVIMIGYSQRDRFDVRGRIIGYEDDLQALNPDGEREKIELDWLLRCVNCKSTFPQNWWRDSWRDS